MNALLRRSRPAGLLLAAGLSVASCSSSSTAAAPSSTAAQTPAAGTSAALTTATSAPASTPDTSAASAPAATGGGECGTAKDAAGKVVTGNGDVKSFEIGAGCDVTITTDFTQTGDPKAIALCDAAGKVAYLVGAKSVTVLGVGNKEIAIGIKGQPCILG